MTSEEMKAKELERAEMNKARHARTKDIEELDARNCVAKQIRRLTNIIADLNEFLPPTDSANWHEGLADARKYCYTALNELVLAEAKYGKLVR